MDRNARGPSVRVELVLRACGSVRKCDSQEKFVGDFVAA